MNSLFYAKMAVSNIRKNKKIFFPYIIMGIFSVMMYYMMVSLMNNDGIRKIAIFGQYSGTASNWIVGCKDIYRCISVLY